MGNAYGAMRSPDELGDRYAVAYKSGLAGGSGDNEEVTSAAISVLGTNAGSALAHGVQGVQYEVLEAEFAIRTSLDDAETISILNLTWQTAPPDSSGDPDTFVDVQPKDLLFDVIGIGAIPKLIDRKATDGSGLVSFTGAVQDPMLVHTASGVQADLLLLVRFKQLVRIPLGREFWRLQFTIDLSRGATDTFDATLVLAGMGNTPAYEEVTD